MDQRNIATRSVIRELILHEYRKGETAATAARIICQTQGKNAVNKKTCYRWYKKFDLDNFGTQDQSRSGRPKVVDDQQLKEYISANPASTSRKMSAEFNCDHKTVLNHLHNLDYVNKRCQDVPHELSQNQKEKRVFCCSDLLDRYEYYDFLD
jgi:[histone H3]-lysine36 N-dimethyltransferase SETMAR